MTSLHNPLGGGSDGSTHTLQLSLPSSTYGATYVSPPSPQKLTAVRGIGSAVQKKLVEHFGSEADALAVLSQRDVVALSSVPGVTEKQAARLVRAYYSPGGVDEVDLVLQTPDISQLYDRILKLVQSRAQTRHAKAKALVTLTPLPVSQLAAIRERQVTFSQGVVLEQANHLHLRELAKELAGLRQLGGGSPPSDFPERLICTTVPEVVDALRSLKIQAMCRVEVLEDLADFSTVVEDNQEVLLLTEFEVGSVDAETFVVVPDNALESPWVNFVPERVLAFYAANVPTLTHVVNVAKSLVLPSEVTPLFPQLTRPDLLADLETLGTHLAKLTPAGEVRSGVDPELRRLTRALSQLDATSLNFQTQLNEVLEEQIEGMQIQLEGKKVLEFLQSEGLDGTGQVDLREYLDEELYELVEAEAVKAEEGLVRHLGLAEDEAVLVEGLFPRELAYPLEAQDEALDRVRSFLVKKRRVREFYQKQEMAVALESFRPWVEDLVAELFEVDYLLMLGRFGADFNLLLPSFRGGSAGLVLRAGRNVFLEESFARDGVDLPVVPVNYEVGQLGVNNPTAVTILSGANSGGKTSLLQLLAQVLLMAHMGLGTPAAEVVLSGFDQLFYYSKPTGTADAGAFETALQTFATMVQNPEVPKFVLADEMEAISEPEASARVISAFLDLLHSQPHSCGVFVSHLADQISRLCQHPIRVDGIEASGLDDNLELVVDRNPRLNYHARSTPQLIVERLVGRSKGQAREVYQEILRRFNDEG